MHVGAPCKAIVAAGDKVSRGQCIAVPEGLGAKIHTSVTGVIKEVNNICVLIQADEVQTEEYIKIDECKSIKDTCFEAGVVGAGGAGFPTHIKLATEIPNGYIIANCIECEPVLSHNIAMIETNPEFVIRGVKYAMEAVKATNGVIAIKEKNKAAIESLEKSLEGCKEITVKWVKKEL